MNPLHLVCYPGTLAGWVGVVLMRSLVYWKLLMVSEHRNSKISKGSYREDTDVHRMGKKASQGPELTIQTQDSSHSTTVQRIGNDYRHKKGWSRGLQLGVTV